MVVESHRRPDYSGIGVECASPKTVAQHHIGRGTWAMLVCRMKESPYLRLHAQKIEIVASDGIPRGTQRHFIRAECRLSISIEGGHVVKGCVSLSVVFKRRIRRS